MKDVTKLDPILQCKIKLLISECKKAGIIIQTREALRTVAEQDALYAKGRTAPGYIVTNAKGSSYSSMHMWGEAVDIVIFMDTDKDKDIDINDLYCVKLMKKVGPIGQKIGLEWGGAWKSIVDYPHYQLPDWGSTPTKLKKMYGTPDKFFATWWKVGKTYTLKINSAIHNTASSSVDSKVLLNKTKSAMKKICKADSKGYAVMQRGSKFTLVDMKICTGYIMGKTNQGYWIPLFYNDKKRI